MLTDRPSLRWRLEAAHLDRLVQREVLVRDDLEADQLAQLLPAPVAHARVTFTLVLVLTLLVLDENLCPLSDLHSDSEGNARARAVVVIVVATGSLVKADGNWRRSPHFHNRIEGISVLETGGEGFVAYGALLGGRDVEDLLLKLLQGDWRS